MNIIFEKILVIDPLITSVIIHMVINRLSKNNKHSSGGESQRIKVVQYLNSSLNNIIYIFDEPSTGLPRCK